MVKTTTKPPPPKPNPPSHFLRPPIHLPAARLPAAVDKDVLRINVEKTEEKREEDKDRRYHR